MKIESFTGGPLPTNAYFITDEATGDCAVIDPGFVNKSLRLAVEKAGAHFKSILLTHGHWDHIAGVAELQRGTDAKLYIYAEDEPFLSNSSLNLSQMITGEQLPPLHADVLLCDGDTVTLGESKLRVIHTPGHTIGSCTFVADGALFTGDTLFWGSAGRTDFPTGSRHKLMDSLHKLMSLKGNYQVYPGHERKTTLDYERNNNPFL